MPLGHESNVARLLAFLVAAWQRDRPTQPLFVTNGTAEDLLTGLKDKRCDVALIDSDTIPADVSSARWCDRNLWSLARARCWVTSPMSCGCFG